MVKPTIFDGLQHHFWHQRSAQASQVGYCPEEDGKVVQLPRGIRYAKKRKGPSAPRGKVNWRLGAKMGGFLGKYMAMENNGEYIAMGNPIHQTFLGKMGGFLKWGRPNNARFSSKPCFIPTGSWRREVSSVRKELGLKGWWWRWR